MSTTVAEEMARLFCCRVFYLLSFFVRVFPPTDPREDNDDVQEEEEGEEEEEEEE